MYTGNPSVAESNGVNFPVYPCAYREHKIHSEYCDKTDGLSLCIQGTLTLPLHSVDGLRFIPVHTGNTLLSLIRDSGIAVYPCAYREHICNCANHIAIIGLSLCIQGTQFSTLNKYLFNRFIPVHKGNTF